mgnify:FL=1
MTDPELSDWLAEHVRGWHKGDWESAGGLASAPSCWLDYTSSIQMAINLWRPLEDMNQVMMLVRNLTDAQSFLVASVLGEEAFRAGYGEDSLVWFLRVPNPARAICMAVKEAVENG